MPPYKKRSGSFIDGLARYKKMKMAPVAGAKVVASAALAKVNKIARKLAREEEVKCVGISTVLGTPLALNNTGQWQHLTQIAEGVTTGTRVGSKITVKRLTLRWDCHHDSTVTYSRARIILLRCKQQTPDATTFATSSLLGNPVDYVNSEISVNTGGKDGWQVLMDEFVSMDNLSYKTKYGVWQKKLNLDVGYNGSNNNDIHKNGLYMFTICDQGTYVPVLNFCAQVYFTDD